MSDKLNMQNHKVSKELLLDTAEKYLEDAMDNLESEHPQNVRKYPEIELNTVEVPTNMVAVLNAIYLNFVKPTRNQPRLTITQSIANELDGYFKYKNPFEAILRDYSVRSNDVIEELRDYLDFLHSNLELCIIYLAGKALGVDLVKVVADE